MGMSGLRLLTLAGREGRNDRVDCSGSIKSTLEIKSLSSSSSLRVRLRGFRLLFLLLRWVIVEWRSKGKEKRDCTKRKGNSDWLSFLSPPTATNK